MKATGAVLILALMLTGCSSINKATEFNGLTTAEGTPIAHISASNVAIHTMFGKKPLWGDASLEKTFADFTSAAKAHDASKVHVVQSSKRAWWFVYPPISFFLTPVTSNVAGEAVS